LTDDLSKRQRDAVAAYGEALQNAKRDQESKFDNAVLLMAGGAFTLSAAFVPQIDGQLRQLAALACAWWSWGLCIAVTVGGYLLSAYAHGRAMRLLQNKQYDLNVLLGGPAKWISWTNFAAYVLLVVGFVQFGRFTFNNLESGARHETVSEHEAETREEEGRGQEGWRREETRVGVEPANANGSRLSNSIQEAEQVNEPTPDHAKTSDSDAKAK
jgi:hypothetical protein